MSVIVVGGGPAGLAAAVGSARLGKGVTLLEKEELGGFPAKHKFHILAPRLETYEEVIEPLIKEVKEKRDIFEEIEVIDIVKSDKKFNVALSDGRTLASDALILANGFESFPAESLIEYRAWEYPDVIPSWKLEEMLNPESPTKGIPIRPSNGKRADEIAVAFCAGSRSRMVGGTYCSLVCCGYSCKQAIEIRKANPNAKVHMFYMDIRTMGEEESLYWQAQEDHGVHFIRGRLAQVEEKGDKLIAYAEDTLLNRRVELPVDLISLDMAIMPPKEIGEWGKKLGIELTENGFIRTKNAVETNVPGLFAAGTASGPKTIEMSIADGFAAAALAVTTGE